MNRTRAAAAGAALVLLLALLFRQGAPGASARPPDHVERDAPRPQMAFTPAPVAPPARDVFRYVGRDDDGGAVPPFEDAVPPSPPPSLADATPPLAPAPDQGPRLVGILRQGGVLKAALATSGEVVIARAGEMVDGYSVVSIDEEDGVVLRDPSGTPVTLSALPR